MTTVPAHQIAADLLSAAAYIETFGLAKGHYGNAGHACCAAGALQVAVFGRTLDDGGDVRTDDSDRYKLARQELLNLLPRSPIFARSVAEWNDKSATTAVVVAAKFREAAKAVFPNA
jgi:hypothetical protein